MAFINQKSYHKYKIAQLLVKMGSAIVGSCILLLKNSMAMLLIS